VHGFRYFDSRDLMGFVDGTENPVADEGAASVVIDEQDPDVAGGTYAMIQKYLHDLDAWNAISVEDQELAIGRRKLDGVELDDATKPGDAHTRLTVVSDDDGEELAILRDNMPFGTVGSAEFGTYFVGYAADPAVPERMLRNMVIGDPEGCTDRILDFSTAVTRGLGRGDVRAHRRPGRRDPRGGAPPLPRRQGRAAAGAAGRAVGPLRRDGAGPAARSRPRRGGPAALVPGRLSASSGWRSR